MKNPNTFVNRAAFRRDADARYTTQQAMCDLRAIWFSHFSADLSTICRDNHPLAGYPVASVVPYVLDAHCRPIVLIASIAEHTQNALANSKASFFLRENRADADVQMQWRVCAIGDLLPVPEAEIATISALYYAHYPNAQDYDKMHNFSFFRLHSKKFRIIMGFGEIRWISADAPFAQAALAPEISAAVIAHMNADHQAAIVHYLRRLSVSESHIQAQESVAMTAINAWGATLKCGEGLYFLPFPQPITSAEEARKVLVSLARA